MHQVVVLLLTLLLIEPVAAVSRLPGALRKKLRDWVASACVRVQDSVGSVVRLVVVSVKSLLLDIIRAAFACPIFILLPLVAAVSIVVNLMRGRRRGGGVVHSFTNMPRKPFPPR
jgi:hypothetical protein